MEENPITVQVALCIRPLIQTEITRGCQLCLETVPKEPQVQVHGTDNVFTYNFVFGPEESQVNFYNTAVKNLHFQLFKGYNVTILAYGQTGSGKTFSMGTTYTADDNMGIIPRAINDIFETMKELQNWDFKITVCFMELYQEQLFDLVFLISLLNLWISIFRKLLNLAISKIFCNSIMYLSFDRDGIQSMK